MKADLHMHTNVSDGAHPPEEVVRLASRGGLDIISITDHDAMSGSEEVCEGKLPDGLQVIRGVEFSTRFKSTELHILGYFREKFPSGLADFVLEVQEFRVSRITQAVLNLNKIGVDVEIDRVLKAAKGDSVSRAHLARELVKNKKVRNVPEAFQKYLDYDHKLVPMIINPIARVLAMIHKEGGLAVWAHPRFDHFDKYIKELRDRGLDGVEVINARRAGPYSLYFERVSDDLGLIKTGGSDWHGYPNDDPLGTFSVDEDLIGDFLGRLL